MAPTATAMISAMTFLSIFGLLDDLEQPRGAHAAADTHGDDGEFRAAPLALDQRVTREPRAGHAVRVAQRDRAATDVQLVIRDAELVPTVDDLHGESFVQFPQVDVGHLLARALQQLRDGEYRADAHFIRLAAGDGEAA